MDLLTTSSCTFLTSSCIFLTLEYAAVRLYCLLVGEGVEIAIKCRNYHFCLSGLFHLSSMGKNLFGQRCPDNRGSTVPNFMILNDQ